MLIQTSKSPLTTAAMILTSVGAINWGLIGILDFNLVGYLLGNNVLATKIVYTLIGISGILTLANLSQILSSPGIKKVD